jgi:hypothetical protein
MKKDKMTEAVFDCLRELYANSEPSADFDKLFEEAPTNEEGQKVIDFMAYEIDKDKMTEIVDKHKAKLKSRRVSPSVIDAFIFNIYLGASPKTKRNN